MMTQGIIAITAPTNWDTDSISRAGLDARPAYLRRPGEHRLPDQADTDLRPGVQQGDYLGGLLTIGAASRPRVPGYRSRTSIRESHRSRAPLSFQIGH